MECVLSTCIGLDWSTVRSRADFSAVQKQSLKIEIIGVVMRTKIYTGQMKIIFWLVLYNIKWWKYTSTIWLTCLNTRHIYPSFLYLERIEKGGKNERVIEMGWKEMQLLGEYKRFIMRMRGGAGYNWMANKWSKT